jgi:hypothetical protein
MPEFYVVPSVIVARELRRGHWIWLAGTARNGRVRKDNPMRMFHDSNKKYIDRWDLLASNYVSSSTSF